MDLNDLYERQAMLSCPYFKSEDVCDNGCWEEPRCRTCEPEGGWDGVVYLDKVLRLVPESNRDDPTLRWPASADGTKIDCPEGWVPCAHLDEKDKRGRLPVFFHWPSQLDPSA